MLNSTYIYYLIIIHIGTYIIFVLCTVYYRYTYNIPSLKLESYTKLNLQNASLLIINSTNYILDRILHLCIQNHFV